MHDKDEGHDNECAYLAKDALPGVELLGEEDRVLGNDGHARTEVGEPDLPDVQIVNEDGSGLGLHHPEQRLARTVVAGK